MYLSDTELLARLDELAIECPQGHPFTNKQIKGASIDLRLSDVFWFQRRGETIDLLRDKAIEFLPRRYWTRKVHNRSQPIELKPGEMVLGRVLEKLTIPDDCAGKFMGRSSYARLGLMVQCTGDFANPGYQGHMPLQLVNLSSQTLRIYPYMSICQMMLIRLSSPSQAKYGGTDVASKYMHDDGGPSYWWRDEYIKQLQAALAAMDAGEAMEQEVYSRLSDVDAEVLERLGKHLSNAPISRDKTADDLLNHFGIKEDRLRKLTELRAAVAIGVPFAFWGVVATALYTSDAHRWTQIFWIAAAVIATVFVIWWYFRPHPRSFLGSREISELPSSREFQGRGPIG